MTKLRELRVTGFRGARFELPLDFTKQHRSVALYGENASGKSTITDALEWFINDRVDHLWREDCKQDALRHVLCDDKESSHVQVNFSGKNLSGTKTLSPELSTTQSNDNDEFTILIDQLQDDRIFLRHSQITRFLDATKSQKRKAIASIIGYDDIIKFRDAIQSTRNSLQKETGYTTAKSLIDSHKTKSMGLVDEIIIDPDGLYKKANELLKPFAITTTITDQKTYLGAIKELEKSTADQDKLKKAQRFDQLEKACSALNTELDAFLKALPAFATPFNELAKEKESVSKLRIGDFLTKGNQVIEDGLFSDPNCPFCLTDYDLNVLQGEVQTRLEAIAELKKRFDGVETLKDTLNSELNKAQARAQGIAQDYADLEKFKKLTGDAKAGSTKLTGLSQSVKTAFDALEALTVNKTFSSELQELSALAKTCSAAAKEEAGKLALTEKEQQITATLTTLAQLRATLADYIKNNKLVQLYEAQILSLSTIFDSFVEIQNKALQVVLDTVSEDVGAFYKKLHPKENIDQVSLRMVGEEGVEFEYAFHGKPTQPPHKYLSESHLNSLGIVLFLANAKIFNKEAKFFVLDDIVTSFDTGHRRRLLRLLKEEFSEWQIILLTHEPLWFDLIKAELSESGWLFKKIQSDGENGIQLEQSAASVRALIDKKRVKHDVSNDIRKLLEATLKEICFSLEVKVVFRFNDINEKRMPDELLSQLRSTLKKKSPNMASNQIFSDLKGSNLIANVGSHDNPQPIVGDDIDVALEDIDKLTGFFHCVECNRYVEVNNPVPGKNKISCRCGETKIDWKT